MKNPHEYLKSEDEPSTSSFLVETMQLIGKSDKETLENILKKVNLEKRSEPTKNKAKEFTKLCKECGIPADCVKTFAESWVKSDKLSENTPNHYFVEVFTGNEWQTVDPNSKSLQLSPSKTYEIKGQKYIKYTEGEDPDLAEHIKISNQEHVAEYIQLQLKKDIGEISKKEYDDAIKQEMVKLIEKLESDFNKKDVERFMFLQTHPDHEKEPLFCRERMLYDRLVVLNAAKRSLNMFPDIKKDYERELEKYQKLKQASENDKLYQKEMAAWIEQNKELKN